VTAFLFSFLMTFEPLRDLVPFSKKNRFRVGPYQWKHFVTLVKKIEASINPVYLWQESCFITNLIIVHLIFRCGFLLSL